MKMRRLSHSIVRALVLGALLVLALGLIVAVGSAQPALPQSLQVKHTLSPDSLQAGDSALGLLVIHNQSSKAAVLDGVTVELTDGVVYVGQAVGSDVTGAAQREGSTLRWTGPFDLAAGKTLTVRYWVVAASATPGRYLTQATVSFGAERLAATSQPLTIEPAAARATAQTSQTASSPVARAVSADVSVSKTATPAAVEPGEPVAYTVVFAKSTPGDVELETITDVLPLPFQYVGLAVGSEVPVEPVDTVEPEIVWQGTFVVPGQGTLTLRYWVWVPDDTEPSPTPYSNTVTATYGANLVGPAQASVHVVGPHVQVAKTAWPQELMVGEPVTYTVHLENIGNGEGVVEFISDTLPFGFVFEEMLPGTVTEPPAGVTGTIVWQGPFTLPVTADMTVAYRTRSGMALGSETSTNRVVALVNGKLTAEGTAVVQVNPHRILLPGIARNYMPPYFVALKAASAAEVVQSGTVIYTVELVNVGSEAGELDVISDTLPAGFTFLNMAEGSDVLTPPNGTTGTITWDLSPQQAQVGSNERLTLKYEVRVSELVGSYSNEVTASTIVGFPPPLPGRAIVVVKEANLLSEDFESGTDGWEPFLNYWRLKPEQWYLQAGAGFGGSTGLKHSDFKGAPEPGREAHDALYMYVGAGSEQWTDYRIDAKVRLEDGAKMGLWVRGKYIPSEIDGLHVEGYYIVWRPNLSARSVELWRIKNSGGTAFHFSDPELIATGDYLMGFNIWYDFAAEVRGNNIQVFVNGTRVIDHNDSTYPKGTVGFFAYKVRYATWDNILVTPLP